MRLVVLMPWLLVGCHGVVGATEEPPLPVEDAGCTPTATCASLGASCGDFDDGCGGTLSCGGCPSGQTCGGAGIPNQCGAGSPLVIANLGDNADAGQVARYSKLEVSFTLQGSLAQNAFLPFDPTPPPGIDPTYPRHRGISVDGLFLPPGESDWARALRQPGFLYVHYDEAEKTGLDGKPADWWYPTGEKTWRVRFSPHLPGAWQYRVSVQEDGASASSAPRTVTVSDSTAHGFVRVSTADPRYFELDDGSPFLVQGFQDQSVNLSPMSAVAAKYQHDAANGVTLVRHWASGAFGSAWLEWVGGRNVYDGYLPRSGLEGYVDPSTGRQHVLGVLTASNTGWYDSCRFQFWGTQAVQRNTNYRLRLEYVASGITGPRVAGSPSYGVVGKVGGGWDVDCHEPGVGTVVTTYGGDSATWATVEGVWSSGNSDFAPKIYLGLENATAGKAWLKSVSLREDLGGGQLGPELLEDWSLEYGLQPRERAVRRLDKRVESAERVGLTLKLVLTDKSDMVFYKLNDDGSAVVGAQADNQDGFYGLGRAMNKTRWLQSAWWRYVQARWGYSPAIHSWELTNEGDPAEVRHYELTDELGKFLRCRVFGAAVEPGDGHTCALGHPNRHLVTTSLWHSFPIDFWGSPKYPNVDYADLHAYISTSNIGLTAAQKEAMQWDSAYYHLGHSLALGGWNLGKPIMRGEAGIDTPTVQSEQPDLGKDTRGVWLHNYVWSQVGPGAMSELYWWPDNLVKQPGPDGQAGLHEVYRYFGDFMARIPLHRGGYEDAGAVLSNTALKVAGQKHVASGRAHLWVQNPLHTWKNVVDGVAGTSGLSGTVRLTGFSPGATFNVEWHAFTTQGVPAVTRTAVSSDSSGALLLTLPTDPSLTDVGIKVGDF